MKNSSSSKQNLRFPIPILTSIECPQLSLRLTPSKIPFLRKSCYLTLCFRINTTLYSNLSTRITAYFARNRKIRTKLLNKNCRVAPYRFDAPTDLAKHLGLYWCYFTFSLLYVDFIEGLCNCMQ